MQLNFEEIWPCLYYGLTMALLKAILISYWWFLLLLPAHNPLYITAISKHGQFRLMPVRQGSPFHPTAWEMEAQSSYFQSQLGTPPIPSVDTLSLELLKARLDGGLWAA